MNRIKTPFTPDAWIKCIHKGEICLGRTYLQSEDRRNKSLQMICLISESGLTRHVLFSEITHVTVLKILTSIDFETGNSIKNASTVRNAKKYNVLSVLASRQLKTEMS